MLHVLLHMGQPGSDGGEAITSEQMARYMDTNPVVVRRTMSGLREAGIVQSQKGHGGGWTLTRPLASISIGEIYRALGSPGLVAIGNRNDNPSCLIEKAVNRTLGDALSEAERLIVARMDAVTLADIADQFRDRMAEFNQAMKEHGHV